MSEIATLQTSGYAILNKQTADPQKTVVVVGVPRSGTSMIASALRAMGVSLGDVLDNAVMEDIDLSGALDRQDGEGLKQLIAARNSRFDLWGFKRPDAFRNMAAFESLFRNVHYVVIFRDPLAIALRNNLSMRAKLLPALQQAASSTSELLAFVCGSEKPMLLVSYEKALLDEARFIDKLAEFVGIDFSSQDRQRVLEALPENREAYWRTSRVQYEGRVDSVTPNRIRGWARGVGLPSAVPVLLFADGRLIARDRADRYREDLEAAGKSGGLCAFDFQLSSEVPMSATIHVEIEGSDVRFYVPDEVITQNIPRGDL